MSANRVWHSIEAGAHSQTIVKTKWYTMLFGPKLYETSKVKPDILRPWPNDQKLFVKHLKFDYQAMSERMSTLPICCR